MRFQIATAPNRDWWLRRNKNLPFGSFYFDFRAHESHRVGLRIARGGLTNYLNGCASRSSLRSAHESPSDIACDLEAQELYSKFNRYKLEMFYFPNPPGKFGIYQMQSYFR